MLFFRGREGAEGVGWRLGGVGRNAVRGRWRWHWEGGNGLWDKWSVGRGEDRRGYERYGEMWHWSLGGNGVCVGVVCGGNGGRWGL